MSVLFCYFREGHSDVFVVCVVFFFILTPEWWFIVHPQKLVLKRNGSIYSTVLICCLPQNVFRNTIRRILWY